MKKPSKSEKIGLVANERVYFANNFYLAVLLLLLQKVGVYDNFVKGAKKSIPLIVDIFPYIASIMIAVALLRASGLTSLIATALSPVFNFLAYQTELVELVLLRPFTGSGSYGLLESVLQTYGPDSYISSLCCVILGCSETIFYVTTVYFSQTKVKRLLYAIPVDLVCAVVGSCLRLLYLQIYITKKSDFSSL